MRSVAGGTAGCQPAPALAHSYGYPVAVSDQQRLAQSAAYRFAERNAAAVSNAAANAADVAPQCTAQDSRSPDEQSGHSQR